MMTSTPAKDVPIEALPHLARSVLMVPMLRKTNFLRAWAGTLAMTPDRLPIIGPVDGIGGYLLATGFSGHGFCLGPIVGKLLSELVVDGEPSISLDELQLSRFE
jgi:sarcosine oxidase subunit beta